MNAGLSCPHCGQNHRGTARFCPTTGSPILAQEPPLKLPKVPTGKMKPETRIGNRYVINKKIAQGEISAVYRALDPVNPEKVWAIKELSASAYKDAEQRAYALQSFHQEANLLKKLSHHNLPEFVEDFSEDDTHYLVMEFVPGKTLQEICDERQEPLSEKEVLPWALQLCDVLYYLHNQHPKIIFRDLKPANIMVTPKGVVKLIDFGVVRFFKPGQRRDTINLGTPGYSPPEATHGLTDERSDIYSLCVTLHQLLTKHDPTTSLYSLPPARTLNPAVSSQIERIIERGIKLQKSKRWETVRELQLEIENLLPASSLARRRQYQFIKTAEETPSVIRRLLRRASGKNTGRD